MENQNPHKKCKHCNGEVQFGQGHNCPVTNQQYEFDNEGDFLISMVVAEATGSTLLGVVAGGNLTGAIVGDLLNDDDHKDEDSKEEEDDDSDQDDDD